MPDGSGVFIMIQTLKNYFLILSILIGLFEFYLLMNHLNLNTTFQTFVFITVCFIYYIDIIKILIDIFKLFDDGDKKIISLIQTQRFFNFNISS